MPHSSSGENGVSAVARRSESPKWVTSHRVALCACASVRGSAIATPDGLFLRLFATRVAASRKILSATAVLAPVAKATACGCPEFHHGLLEDIVGFCNRREDYED